MAKRSHLGDLEELVLLAVMRLGEEAYGGWIRDELKPSGSKAETMSTTYPPV